MAKKKTTPSDDENSVEEGSGDHRTKKGSGVGTHTQEKEFQNRMKRLKKVIDADEDEDCTTAFKNCPIQNCSFTPQSDLDHRPLERELIGLKKEQDRNMCFWVGNHLGINVY